jgi:1,4-dihydroxy-2-naphthoate octaprenyltransferase
MTLRQFGHIVELRTKTVSLSTFSFALLYSIWRSGAPAMPDTALCFLAVLLVDMGTTAFNSYFDYLHGVDESRRNREKDKVLVHEGVEPGQALFVALGCFAAAGILGIVLAFLSGFWIILAGGASLAVAFLYSGGPRPISSTPFGELFAGGFLGTILFVIVAGVSSGGALPAGQAALASLPGAALIASILTVNNLCDQVGDRAAGRRTMPLVLGARLAEGLLYAAGWVAFGLPALYAWFGIYPSWSALGAGIAAFPALAEYRRMAFRGYRHDTKGPAMGSIMKILLIWGGGQAAGLAAGLLTGL